MNAVHLDLRRLRRPDNKLSRPPKKFRTPARSRRGITLMEVLISMGVMAVGLMGVAAMIPAGRSEIQAATKLDYASMVGRQAFRELLIRDYLNPLNWKDFDGEEVFDRSDIFNPFMVDSQQPTRQRHCSFVLDSLGIAAGFTDTMPTNTPGTLPLLTRITALKFFDPTISATHTASDIATEIANHKAASELAFRCSSDLVTTARPARDLPPKQLWNKATAGAVSFLDDDGVTTIFPTTRASNGNYSWIATIVSDTSDTNLRGLDSKVTVSVAVFFKRNLSSVGAGEYVADVSTAATFNGMNGQLLLNNFVSKATPPVTPVPPVKPGQWIMLAGNTAGGGALQSKFQWYRVLSANKLDPATGQQQITVAGKDWHMNFTTNLKVWIFDGIVAVYEKDLSLHQTFF